MIEPKVGEVFEYKGGIYRTYSSEIEICGNCKFRKFGLDRCEKFSCQSDERKDKTSVIFLEINPNEAITDLENIIKDEENRIVEYKEQIKEIQENIEEIVEDIEYYKNEIENLEEQFKNIPVYE